MPSRPLNVLVLMGGVSGEHSISLRSAATVIPALRTAGHTVHTVAISKAGQWLLGDHSALLADARHTLAEVDASRGTAVTIARGETSAQLVALDHGAAVSAIADLAIDVVFPVLHGPGGEDGTIQGMIESVGLPIVGAGCTASALAMDKLAMKTLCAGAEIAQVEFLAAGNRSPAELATAIQDSFGLPCFVKPANLGSSVGISRVAEPGQLQAALSEARRWDDRVIIERAIDAREIEVALLGGQLPRVSPPGEIITPGGFYDFAAKYVGSDAELVIPARLSDAQLEHIFSIAIRVWELIGCRGMARADFFIERDSERVLFNEFNTIPGFTQISMYPRLWRQAGVSTSELLDQLLDIATDGGCGRRV